MNYDRYLIAVAPEVTQEERQRLLDRHQRRDERWLGDGYDDPFLLTDPECGCCREPWGRDGCSTVRAVTALAVTERKLKEAEHYAANVAVEASKFSHHRLDRAQNYDAIQLSMMVSNMLLQKGGLPLIDATLLRMRKEYQQWFGKVNADPHEELAGALHREIEERIRHETKPDKGI